MSSIFNKRVPVSESTVYVDADQNTHYEGDKEFFQDYATIHVNDKIVGRVVEEDIDLFTMYRTIKALGYGEVNVSYMGIFIVGDGEYDYRK